MNHRGVNWSQLTSELLTSIADRLDTQFDTRNFESVCKNWNASTAFCVNNPQSLSSPIFPQTFSISECNYTNPLSYATPLDITRPIVLVPCSIYLVQSSINPNLPPWLCIVEELHPGKFYLRRSTLDFPDQVPKQFNVSCFHVKEVKKFHTIGSISNAGVDDDLNDWLRQSQGFHTNKVVLFLDPNCKNSPTTVDDYNAVVLNSYDGGLHLVSIKNKRMDKITGPNVRMYDDVVNFKGSIFAIDRKGRGYIAGYNETKLSVMVSRLLGEGSGTDRKKRLVVADTGELYLIQRCPLYMKGTFKLYKLNEARNSWDDVDGIGPDRIILVTSEGCLFTMSKNFPGLRGNCIFFARGQFPGYTVGSSADKEIFGRNCDSNTELDAGVFSFEDGEFTLESSYYASLLRAPSWLLSDLDAFNSVSTAKIQTWRDFCDNVSLESNTEVETSTEAKEGVRVSLLANEGAPTIIDVNSFPDIIPKTGENAVTQVKFQGVDICLDLVPILEKIWNKYGNVIEDHVVKSDSLLKWCLETLAKMVIILQTNSSECLSNSQEASFLRATFRDLEYLHIRVDWLAPFVEKIPVSNSGCETV